MQRELLRHRHRRKLRRIIYGVVALLIIIFGILLFRSQRPMTRAKGQSAEIARKVAGVQKVNRFYTSELNRTYYTVLGTNNRNSQLYVIISKDDGKATVLNANKGINQSNAINQVKQTRQVKKILNAAPSLFNDQPVWIISYLNHANKLCYETLNYANGRSIQSITNI
ncbi:cell wall elongation regulator TseB-like domain-containing protein [Lactobacillaceae bacterium Melli_B3]